MTLINNLTSLFTAPSVNITPSHKTGFRGGVTQPFQFGESVGIQDRFTTNPIYDYFAKSKQEIERMAKTNPRILQLSRKYNIPIEANIETLEALKNGHLKDTRVLAAKICSVLSGKYDINSEDVQSAAMLHDYGKVLIPLDILNKPECLTPEEKEIMNLHSEFGYELLKKQGSLNNNVLRLIKYHHQKPNGSGYPKITDDYTFDISTQIIEIADMYSALTEERPYHKACSKEEALEIIAQKLKPTVFSKTDSGNFYQQDTGMFSQEVFDALKSSLQ